MILTINHRNLYRGVAQRSRRPQATKASSDDYDTWQYSQAIISSTLNIFGCTQCISDNSVCSILYFSHGIILTKVYHILISVIAYSKMREVTTSIHNESSTYAR